MRKKPNRVRCNNAINHFFLQVFSHLSEKQGSKIGIQVFTILKNKRSWMVASLSFHIMTNFRCLEILNGYTVKNHLKFHYNL